MSLYRVMRRSSCSINPRGQVKVVEEVREQQRARGKSLSRRPFCRSSSFPASHADMPERMLMLVCLPQILVAFDWSRGHCNDGRRSRQIIF